MCVCVESCHFFNRHAGDEVIWDESGFSFHGIGKDALRRCSEAVDSGLTIQSSAGQTVAPLGHLSGALRALS